MLPIAKSIVMGNGTNISFWCPYFQALLPLLWRWDPSLERRRMTKTKIQLLIFDLTLTCLRFKIINIILYDLVYYQTMQNSDSFI